MSALDRELQLFVVEHRLDPLDPLFVWLSFVGSAGIVWIGIGCALAAAVWRLSPILLTAAVVWSADVLATLGKVIFGRDRPFVAYPDEAPLGPRPGSSSFPSGHATTAFAGALVLSFLVPRAWPLFYALAAAIAYSRLYLGVHYPADVAAGALLGTAVAAGLVLALRARRRRTGA